MKKRSRVLNIFFGLMLVLPLNFIISVDSSEARRSFLSAVEDTCGVTLSDCSLCHVDPKGAGERTAEGEAFLASGTDSCYFCPEEPVCGGGDPVDNDGDTYDETVDCNDNDASINPGALEACTDAKDNDCNDAIDCLDTACASDPACETPTPTCTDADGDGYSAEGGDCGQADCNDADTSINPGACDVKSDGIDQDCSGKDRTKGKACPGGSEPPVEDEICTDGIDNDGDRKVDCRDRDCRNDPAC